MTRQRPSRRRANLTVLVIAGVLTSGCSAVGVQSPSPASGLTATSSGASTQAVECAGTRGGQLILYSARGLEYWYADVLTTFETDCGVQIFYVSGTSAQVEQRLESESSAPFADLAVLQAPFITSAADAHVIDSADVPNAAGVPATDCDAARRWCTVVGNAASWVARADVATTPQWDDLLGAAYHGRLGGLRPDASLDGLATLELLAQTRGQSGALEYLGRLEPQLLAHYTNTDTLARDVAQGTVIAGDGDVQENLNDVDQYGNLHLFFPAAGTGGRATLAIPYGAGLVSGGRNRDNARALLDFMWSTRMQALVGQAYGLPARPDVTPTDTRSKRLQQTLSGVQIIHPDWEAFATDAKRLVPQWLQLRTAPDSTSAPSVLPTVSLPPAPSSPSPTP